MLKLLPISQTLQGAKSYVLSAYREFPNSSLHNLPLIIYRPFVATTEESKSTESGTRLSPDAVESLLGKNGLNPAWRYGMFPYNHYHSNTHEVLVPYRGTAELAFGHDESPDMIRHHAKAGDVYILPAGMTHRSLSQSNDFSMVGSYPVASHNWDNCKGSSGLEESSPSKDELWASVKRLGIEKNRLKLDPIYGSDEGSPISTFWV